MLYCDADALKCLNEEWQNYIKILRLKHAFFFPTRLLIFINTLQFISCEDNSKQLADCNLSPLCQMEEPLYKLVISFHNDSVDDTAPIFYYSFYDSWFINSLSFKNFFQVDQDIEKNLCSLLKEFKIFERLGRIYLDKKTTYYKNKYIGPSLHITDIYTENEEFYFVFTDGTRVKLVEPTG